jgi:ribosomal protein S18 acetylase RimI-like enzyme
MNDLTLRKASPNDSEFAYCVRRDAFRGYVEQVEGWDEDQQRRLHERRFGAQDFRVISLADTDVGIMAVVVAPDCLKVNQLFLLPEHQGEGIGRSCMLLLMEEARQRGVPVCLRVMKVNRRALAFYQRLGFMRTGETDTHHLMEWGPQRQLAADALARPAEATGWVPGAQEA